MILLDYNDNRRLERMKKKYKIISVILLVVIIVIIAITRVMSSIENNLDRLKGLEIKNVDLTTVQDGSYLGSYKEFPISVTV